MSTQPLRVLMVCAGGMSSSLLEDSIAKAARAAGHFCEVKAISSFQVGQWDLATQVMDVLLIAPQVRFLRRNLARRLEPLGVLVLDIEPMHFGMADGEAIFQQIMAAMQARDAGK